MKIRLNLLTTIVILSGMLLLLCTCSQRESVYGLTCDYKVNPVGLDTKHPKFSWKIKFEGFGQYQIAYRIEVSHEEGEIFWDSKQVKSDQSILIPYGGKPLQSGESYSWKVKVWDEDGVASTWSKPSTWTTGIMNADEWKAKWIASEGSEPADAAPFFRKEFSTGKIVGKAYVYISGLGYSELRINGEKIGNNVLDPAQTDYEKRVFYTVYDITKNLVKGSNAPGTMINLRFAETIDQDGHIDVASTGVMATTSEQADQYYCAGAGPEVYKPRFKYHGFRYIEVTGAPSIPEDFKLTGIVVHTDALKAGEFECSDTLLNRISQTALWTLRGNLYGLLTDCPHRERCGWLGDAHLAAESTMYHMQTADFWIKYIRDIETSLDNGLPTNVAPGLRIKWVGRADWGAAMVLLPWYVYQYYGDLSIIEEQYPNMKRYIQFLEEIAEDGIVTNGFGDWYDPPAEGPEAISVPNPKYTSTGVTTTSLYCAALQIMIRICELLENEDDIGYYQRLEAETRDGFNKHFYTAESAYGSQTANTVALRYNLVKEENREHVLNALIEDIAAHDYHFTTGVQGAKHLYNVLSENGYGDVAYQVITNKTFPSIPYLFSLGATTNWENWSTTPNQRGVPRSKNHPMNTGYASWFFQSVGGIKPDPGIPGFKRTILSPGFNPYLEWARASYNSPYGEIISSWRRENNEILWQISVPPNSTAEIILPAGGFDISGGLEEGIIEKTEKGSYMIGSGNYNVLVSESREVLQSD